MWGVSLRDECVVLHLTRRNEQSTTADASASISHILDLGSISLYMTFIIYDLEGALCDHNFGFGKCVGPINHWSDHAFAPRTVLCTRHSVIVDIKARG